MLVNDVVTEPMNTRKVEERFCQPMPSPAILVVEGQESVRRLLDIALGQYGFTVRLAAGGMEALDLYRQHRDCIALVLLDVQMDDLDGPGTLAALKEINPHVRCCFMSGHTGPYSTGQLLAMGAAHVLAKPFRSLPELAQTLWEVASGRQEGR